MLFPTTLLLASTASATCLHGLSMFKRAEGGALVPKFGYAADNGPFVWASLAPENEACRTGTNQSPINLDTEAAVQNIVTRRQPVEGNEGPNGTAAAADRPVVDIPKQSVLFENLGTTIEVVMNGTTKFQNTDYRLVQFHMHTPSEHHINGEYFPLEVHMVHQGVADNTKLAVIALMFQVSSGASDPIIAGLTPSLPKIQTPGSTVEIPEGLDFTSALAKVASSDILQYSGSLTTPPCAEGVTFLVVKDPLDIGVADFNAIKKMVKFNARFIQNALGSENMLGVGGKSGSATGTNVDVGLGLGLKVEA